MNITYSEDDAIIEILIETNLFHEINDKLESYGFSLQFMENLAGLYCNSIQFLVSYIGSQ